MDNLNFALNQTISSSNHIINSAENLDSDLDLDSI